MSGEGWDPLEDLVGQSLRNVAAMRIVMGVDPSSDGTSGVVVATPGRVVVLSLGDRMEAAQRRRAVQRQHLRDATLLACVRLTDVGQLELADMARWLGRNLGNPRGLSEWCGSMWRLCDRLEREPEVSEVLATLLADARNGQRVRIVIGRDPRWVADMYHTARLLVGGAR